MSELEREVFPARKENQGLNDMIGGSAQPRL